MLSKRWLVFIGLLSLLSISIPGAGFLKKTTQAATTFTMILQGPATVPAGQTVSYLASAVNNGTAVANGVLDVEIMDASNQKVFQQFFTNQNFGTGQTVQQTVSWVPANPGTYTAKVGIFDTNWSPLLAWNDSALSITVSGPTNAAFSGNGTASPAVLMTGQSVTLSGQVTNTGNGSANNVTVMLEVANAAGVNVFQQLFNGENFAPGQTQAYSTSWTPASPGSYTFSMGVFGAQWSSLITWMNGVATVTVNAPATAPVMTKAAVSGSATTSGSAVSSASGSGATSYAVASAGQAFAVATGVGYVDPNSSLAQAASAMQSSNPSGAALLQILAAQPTGVWFGDWNGNIYQDVKTVVDAAARKGSAPLLVAYNIPERDCGGYSGGGASSPGAYQAWIQSFASAIGGRKATVILEPDALANMGCLSQTDQATRLSLLSSAVGTFKSLGNTAVYLDAGNPNWIPAGTMAQRLTAANVASASGFSVNVSNFFSTSADEQYGDAVSALTGNKHYVVDTSRNGNGPDPNYNWCNPVGRAVGMFPTTNTGNSLVDKFLWVKPPGESDGACNGGPSAGTFWPQYAISLAQQAGL